MKAKLLSVALRCNRGQIHIVSLIRVVLIVLVAVCTLWHNPCRAQQWGPADYVDSDAGVPYFFRGTGDYTDEGGNTISGDWYSSFISGMGYDEFIDSGGSLWTWNSGSFASGGHYTSLHTEAGVNLFPGLKIRSDVPLGFMGDAFSFVENGVYIYKFYYYGPAVNDVFSVASSPYYWMSSDRMLIDRTSGSWPPSNIFPVPPPQQIDINGNTYGYSTSAVTQGGQQYSDSTVYIDAATGLQAGVDRYFDNGVITGGDIWGYFGTQYFTGSFDPNTWALHSLSEPVTVNFSGSSQSPAYGPPFISWNGRLLQFQYTTSDNKDWYSFSDGVDPSCDVFVGQDGSVLCADPTTFTGTYNRISHAFSWISEVPANFFAQDANGNPIGLPIGMTFLFGSAAPGHTLLGPNGATYSPSYSYQRPDPSWGLKYVGLPNGVFLVQDENHNYTAPPYKFVSSAETIENALSGWPATNIYRSQLYINGILCTMVSGSQYDSGAGLPRTGGVSYRASAYDLTVVLSWNWDSGTGFHGYITGKYGQSSSFKGSWDGLDGFTGLTNGAIASVTAPTNIPTDNNPPQISVNGTALNFDSLASTALANAGTPGDVYSGPLGQTLTIFAGGVVSFVPGTGATAISGSYNSTTHTFSFGSSGNTVTIPGTNGSTATITATDTSGHNLANSASTSTGSGGVTEINGALDVQGNSFTLGSWTDSSQTSIPGFLLAFTPPAGTDAALLRFGSPIAVSNWVWSHAVADGANTHQPVMQLDSSHRLSLFAPTDGTTPKIILDPAGVSLINGPIQIAPQGDVLMGEFGPQNP